MSYSSTLPLRLWRVHPLSTNPLMRASDRFEMVVRVLVIALALLAVPMAGAAGTATYTSSAERIRAENSSKVLVTGTVTADPVRRIKAERYGGEEWFEASVQWYVDGRATTATVGVPAAAERGDDVPVWIGPDGTATGAPQSPDVAAVAGISRGLLVLLAVWSGAVAVIALLDWLLSSRRSARWESEWRCLNRPMGHDAS